MTEVETERVEIVRWAPSNGGTDDPDSMNPARGKHSRPSVWRRTVVAGQDALANSAVSIAVQVDKVAEQMVDTLERRQRERRDDWATQGVTEPAWQAAEIEVAFGVQLTGEATVAIFSGSTETSAQIVLRFTRAPAG